jgi:D-alanine-D-alanine ligase
MDFRVNDKGEVFFLEVNFTCSVFYTDGYEGSGRFYFESMMALARLVFLS